MSRLTQRQELQSAAAARHATRIVSQMSTKQLEHAYKLRFPKNYKCKNKKKALIASMGREIMILNDSGLMLADKQELDQLANKLGISNTLKKEIGNEDHSESQKLVAQAIAIEIVKKGVPFSIHPTKYKISLHDKPVDVNQVIELYKLDFLNCLSPEERLRGVRRFRKILDQVQRSMREEGEAQFALLVGRNNLIDQSWVHRKEHQLVREKVAIVEATRVLQQEMSSD